MAKSDRLRRVIGATLAAAYGIGSIAGTLLEYRDHLFSSRFDLPAELLYATFVVQAACAVGVLIPRFARPAALCLTVTSVGAVAAHFRIGSPATSVAGFIFSGVQLWFWYLSGGIDRNAERKRHQA